MQVSRSEFRQKLAESSTDNGGSRNNNALASSSGPSSTQPQRKVNDFVDHRCPPVEAQRGPNSTRIPTRCKNESTNERQLSLPFKEPSSSKDTIAKNTPAPTAANPYPQPRFPLKQTDVTQHASEAIAVGHGNIFKGASVTSKGWTMGKFV